jgi:hypothetical protein
VKYYVLHQYNRHPSPTLVRFFVTNIEVPEKSYDCENYRLALDAEIATSDWVPANGFQLGLPEWQKASDDMQAAADTANDVEGSA